MYYAFSKNDIDYFKTSYGIFDEYTLGNLGGSNVICQQTKIIKAPNVELLCPHGTVMKSDKLVYGIINQGIDNDKFCLEQAILDYTNNKS